MSAAVHDASSAAERIAAGLREFGYPDVGVEMVTEITAAMKRGDAELPHGVIGMFVRSMAEDMA